jgi:hypothetical protein
MGLNGPDLPIASSRMASKWCIRWRSKQLQAEWEIVAETGMEEWSWLNPVHMQHESAN